MRRLILVGLACFAIAPAYGAETFQISVDGQQRKYTVERPAAQGPSSTIIVLHGAFGTADSAVQQTALGTLGPRNGFAVVFPQARTVVWNLFPQGLETRQVIDFFGQRGGVPNDIGFLQAVVSDLIRSGIADRSRIYIAGGSNGGLMALAMVCNNAGLFAGAGIAVASMIDQPGIDCRPAKPMPIVFMHGTADTIVPYRGGPVAPLGGRWISSFDVWPAERTVSFFRDLNGCTGQPERSEIPHVVRTRSSLSGRRTVEAARSLRIARSAAPTISENPSTSDARC